MCNAKKWDQVFKLLRELSHGEREYPDASWFIDHLAIVMEQGKRYKSSELMKMVNLDGELWDKIMEALPPNATGRNAILFGKFIRAVYKTQGTQKHQLLTGSSNGSTVYYMRERGQAK